MQQNIHAQYNVVCVCDCIDTKFGHLVGSAKNVNQKNEKCVELRVWEDFSTNQMLYIFILKFVLFFFHEFTTILGSVYTS